MGFNSGFKGLISDNCDSWNVRYRL